MVAPYGLLSLNTRITNYVLYIMMNPDFCFRNQDGVVHRNLLYYTLVRRLMQ